MTVFSSSAQATSVFAELFETLVADDAFVRRLRDAGLSLHLQQTKPEVELFVDADGVRTQDFPAEAAVRIRMSSDTAHALWLGRLVMPIALATGRVRVRGNVGKVLEFLPLLQPAFDRYGAVASAAGVAV
ncbi:MAG TPA: SCP2 sterol-binding domain-containing protein [Rugosimonospora sp.]|nr:SCP2 sterol-binding domain-containing protein [Rugosimonospora sp.]